MSVFIPFKAIRPVADKAKEISSRPYDVLDTQEARDESKNNPNSFYRVIKPEIEFSDTSDQYAPIVYKKGKKNFDRLIDEGLMVQDDTENYYVYRLSMDGHSQVGIVGCCSIHDYFNNVIKKHELTRPEKEEDRKNHIRYSKLHYEAVFLTYPHVNEIDKLVSEIIAGRHEYNFTADDGIQHTLWVIKSKTTIEAIKKLFEEQVPSVYVADGHHRTAAGALVGKEILESNGNSSNGHRYDYFMAVLIPDNQVKIMDYNRVVKDLNGMNSISFLEKISDNFHIEEVDGQYRPEAFHHIGMYLDNRWYKLVVKEGSYDNNDPIDILDVTILSKQILDPLLNIVDQRTDNRIDFVGGIRGLGELEKRVNSGEMSVAFALHPVSMNQIINISDNDMIMPPKVTWFEPKLRSGLFIHQM